MDIESLRFEAQDVLQQVWFVQSLTVVEQTNETVTMHLRLTSDLFVQVFFSERSGRFSLALVSPIGRIYGRDREYGKWHRHPFEKPDEHEPTPQGMSSRPIEQFLAEVEQILLENELI